MRAHAVCVCLSVSSFSVSLRITANDKRHRSIIAWGYLGWQITFKVKNNKTVHICVATLESSDLIQTKTHTNTESALCGSISKSLPIKRNMVFMFFYHRTHLTGSLWNIVHWSSVWKNPRKKKLGWNVYFVRRMSFQDNLES